MYIYWLFEKKIKMGGNKINLNQLKKIEYMYIYMLLFKLEDRFVNGFDVLYLVYYVQFLMFILQFVLI